jgi:hypothetical protein
MPLAELVELAIAILATGLLLSVAGAPRHPRVNAVLSLLYSAAVLFTLGHRPSLRVLILALATAFGALVLSRLAAHESDAGGHAAVSVSKLRSHVPRL